MSLVMATIYQFKLLFPGLVPFRHVGLQHFQFLASEAKNIGPRIFMGLQGRGQNNASCVATQALLLFYLHHNIVYIQQKK